MIDIFQQFERLHDNNIMLSFKGEVTFDLVKSILDIIEGRLEQIEPNLKIKRKVYNVLVECLQNLSHHIEETERKLSMSKTAILLIWSDQNSYKVGTGNLIPKEKIQVLNNRLEKINAVSKEELRALYKEVLNNQQFSEKGGGGLGFLDIARKSGQKLNYNFNVIDNDVAFFSLQIDIPKN